MAATGNDCYFYYSGSCIKGDSCNFRHQPAAIGNDVTCDLWSQGICTRPVCEFRHAILNKSSSLVKCMWEDQPSGCMKPHCTYMHSKPKAVTPNMAGLISHSQFPPGSHLFRAPGLGQSDLNSLNQESNKGLFGPNSLDFADKVRPPMAAIPPGLMGSGPLHLANPPSSLLGNPPLSVINMSGADQNQMFVNIADTDNNFPEQVKLFRQMLNRLGKNESPKKEKDKSKRRVIPKYSRSGDLNDYKLDKSERKRESSKKKKSRDKSKKSDRKDRSHKSKSKPERKKVEDKSPKLVQDKGSSAEYDDADRQPSDFTESPKSRRSSSEDEDLDFSVKSYEEILREKALRNLLEKKKMREQNESGALDVSNRAKIEEIEKELREVTRARQRKEKEEVKRISASDKEEVEPGSFQEGKDDLMLQETEVSEHAKCERSSLKEHEVDVTKMDELDFPEVEVTEKADVEGNFESESGGQCLGEDIRSPVSSEISLQADDEDLSFGEEEKELSTPKRGVSVVTTPKKDRGVDKEKEKERQKERKKDRTGKEVVKVKVKRGKMNIDKFKKKKKESQESNKSTEIEHPESNDEIKDGIKSCAPFNKSFELGIKSFEEIMAEKRQRKKPDSVEESNSAKQLVSVVKPQGTVHSSGESNPTVKEENEKTGNDTNESKGKRGKRLIRKVQVKDSFVEARKNKSGTLEKQSAEIVKSITINTPIHGSMLKKGTANLGETEALKTDKECLTSVPISEANTKSDVKVKSFEEIMREKRARQQQSEQAGKLSERINEDAKQDSVVGGSSPKLDAVASVTGSVTERTRRLLLKRPSSKAPTDNVKASASGRNLINPTVPETSQGKQDGREEVVVSVVSLRSDPPIATVFSSAAQINTVESTLTTQSTSNSTVRNEVSESVVARISPFLVTPAELPPSLSALSAPNSSSSTTRTVTSIAAVNEADVALRPLKSPRERRKIETSRKRLSSEETKAPGREQADEDGQGPSPTKRVKSTNQKVHCEAREVDTVDEALEAKERRNSDLLLDEEIEREIANLSPLSAEDYDEIDEEDLLMEVDAMINE